MSRGESWVRAQGRAGRGTADGPPAAAGPVGPRRRTAGLPVKGARCARVAGDGLTAALDREPRRPCTSAPSAAGGQRPAAPAGPGRPALSQPVPGRQLVTDNAQRPRKAWRERAACRDVDDPDAFFPTAEAGPERDAQVTAAKAVCARCRCARTAWSRPFADPVRHRRRPDRARAPPAAHARRRGRARARRVERPGAGGAVRRPGSRDERAGASPDRAGAAGRGPDAAAGRLRVPGQPAHRRTVGHQHRHAAPTSRAHQGAGEGSTAATGLPSGSPQHTTPRAGTRAPEGHERR